MCVHSQRLRLMTPSFASKTSHCGLCAARANVTGKFSKGGKENKKNHKIFDLPQELQTQAHCIPRSGILPFGDQTHGGTTSGKCTKHKPKWQIQSRSQASVTLNLESRTRVPENKKTIKSLVHLQGLEPWTH